MACYRIIWRPSTKKDLRRVSKSKVQKIIETVEALAQEPRPLGSTKLSGSDLTYRIRVGEYRIIYEVCDKIVLVEVIKVGHRKNVYKK